MPSGTRDDWETYVERKLGLSFEGSRGKWLRCALDSAQLDPSEFPANGDMAAHICDALTVQESYFFREPSRLSMLKEHVLPAFRDEDRDLRVWSAGCGAGEEAYSLAMLLSDSGFEGRYRVLGTDLSSAAVAQAERGVYTQWSLRGLDNEAVSRGFTSLAGGFRVRDQFRVGVRFEQQNLLAPAPPDSRRFDLILCRNVLIYFIPDAVRRAGKILAGSLAPGGWLLLGVSDPLLECVAGLEPVRTKHGVMYRRLSESRTPVPPPAGEVRPLSVASCRRTKPIPKSGPGAVRDTELPTLIVAARRALEMANPQSAETLARRALDISATSWQAHELLIQALEQRGLLDASLDAAAAAVAALPRCGEARQLLALMLLERGRVPQALVVAREAVYLAPKLAEAHFVLARVHELGGNMASARRARRNGEMLSSRGQRR
jgi:chemotaxis protein methyltransferase CheR